MEQAQQKVIVAPADLEAFTTVQTWFSSWREQWGEELPPSERTDKLNCLFSFCQSLQTTPDEMINQCTLVKEGVRRISVKGRRFYWDKIKEIQGSGNSKAANTLRSFFIHNGIMMQTNVKFREVRYSTT